MDCQIILFNQKESEKNNALGIDKPIEELSVRSTIDLDEVESFREVRKYESDDVEEEQVMVYFKSYNTLCVVMSYDTFAKRLVPIQREGIEKRIN